MSVNFDRLQQYLMMQFIKGFVSAYLALASVVLLFDTVELLRRAASRDFVPASTVFGMGLLKLPQMMELLIPFVFLFGAMFVFWRLNRSHELVVIRTSGISVWQFLKPGLIIAGVWGLLQITLLNPFSAALYNKFSQLDTKYFQKSMYQSFISTDGLWLRQVDGTTTMILHAGIVEPDLGLRDVNAFLFDRDFNFMRRIDADSAKLDNGEWTLANAASTDTAGVKRLDEVLHLASPLTRDKIEESFAPPESLSIWKLPQFIQVLENSGFTALPHRLYFHSLLTTPFMLMAMILIAACFSITPNRNRPTLLLVTGAIFSGFLFYSFSDVVHALGASGRIPIILAAWAPFFITAFLGVASLLHNEDG